MLKKMQDHRNVDALFFAVSLLANRRNGGGVQIIEVLDRKSQA